MFKYSIDFTCVGIVLIDSLRSAFLCDQIYDSEALPKWIQLSKRRLKTIGGIPAMSGTRKEPLPPWAESFIDVMLDSGLQFPSRPNHILLNEYCGMIFHESAFCVSNGWFLTAS